MSFKNLNPYELHKRLINEYVLTQKGSTRAIAERDSSRDRRDIDVIRENHRFLWDEESAADSWEQRLAKRYYDKLFKEYCICDLSRYKENKVALRWRTETEVVSGRGQFSCGNKKCAEKEGLKSWEVNFAYVEGGEKKNALVKLRLCADCSAKLNHHTKKKEVKHLKRAQKRKRSRSKELKPSTSEGGSKASEEPTDVSASKPTTSDTSDAPPPKELWKRTHEPEEKSREEEFESYLEDLLL